MEKWINIFHNIHVHVNKLVFPVCFAVTVQLFKNYPSHSLCVPNNNHSKYKCGLKPYMRRRINRCFIKFQAICDRFLTVLTNGNMNRGERDSGGGADNFLTFSNVYMYSPWHFALRGFSGEPASSR